MKKATEVAVLIDDHPCEVMRALGRLGVKARTERIKLREGSTDHVVEAELNEAQLAELKKGAVKVVRLGDNRVWVRTNGCVVCKLLSRATWWWRKSRSQARGASFTPSLYRA
jgi:hypothetical protein